MPLERWTVQFAVMVEVEVNAYDDIAAANEAARQLTPRQKKHVLRFRVMDPDGQPDGDWERFMENNDGGLRGGA